jgi:biopolymer transport protein TolR
MAMQVGGAKGGLQADINVTPLCDVMLVLLIIMMLVAPMLQKGVDVRLPEAGNTVDKPDTQEQTVIAITADKRFFVDGVPVADTEFLSRVQSKLESKREKLVVIKGDTDAPYSAIMQAMDDLRQAGIEDVGLITERKLRAGQAGGH